MSRRPMGGTFFEEPRDVHLHSYHNIYHLCDILPNFSLPVLILSADSLSRLMPS